MEREKIERFVNDILTISAIGSEGGEQPVGLLLYHLLTAVSLYEVMTAEEKEQVDVQTKKLQYFFRTRFVLKERKRNKEKKNFPPNPLIKEIANKEKAEKTLSLVCDAKEAFRKECMERMGQYDRQQLADFFNYWSQENADGKMMFEKERFWNIDNRLKRWVKNQYSAANSAAAIRLKRLQKKDDTSRLQSQAAERERTEARMERERAEQRKNAVSYEEYLAMKEKNVEC